jgi:hypothetical protein
MAATPFYQLYTKNLYTKSDACKNDEGSAFSDLIAGSSYSGRGIPQKILERRARLEKLATRRRSFDDGFPPKRIPSTQDLLDAIDTPVLSRRYHYRGWGLLNSFDKNFECHFEYDVEGIPDPIIDDQEQIVLGGQIKNDIPGIQAIVKVNGRHMVTNISGGQYTSHGLVFIELPWIVPAQTAWLAPPYFNTSTMEWTDRPSSFASGRNSRSNQIALQGYRLNPGLWLSYWDLTDDLKESPILVEPTRFSTRLANRSKDE